MRLRQPAAYAAAIAAVAAALVIALTAGHPYDYASATCSLNPLCDDPAPAINALAAGHVGQFFDRQPLMGPVSLVLRAPFVAAVGGGELGRYRAGLVPCLLVVALLGACLALIAAARERPWWFQLLVGVGAVVNPVTFWAIRFGHPEELLGAALLAGAALAAVRRRPLAAGLLLGLAIGTKLWAVLAVPLLVVAAVGGDRRRMLAATAATAAVCLLVPFVAAPTQFHRNLDSLAKIGSKPGGVSRTDIWFPLVKPVTFYAPTGLDARGAVLRSPVPAYDVPDWVGRVGHALIAAAALAIALVAVRLRWAREQVVLGLALLLLLRCILDSGTRSYYHAPFLLTVLTYEVLVRRRLPWLALSGALAIEAYSRVTPHIHSDALFGAAYVAWSVPLAAAMALELGTKIARRTSGSAQTAYM